MLTSPSKLPPQPGKLSTPPNKLDRLMKRYHVSPAQRRDYGKFCMLAVVGLTSLSLGLLTSYVVFLWEGARPPPKGMHLRTQDGLASCDEAAICQAPLVTCGVVNACGKEVYCGGCQFPEWCGGGGPAQCGCQPRTCESFGRTCGQVPDGCGGAVTCGPPCEDRVIDPFSEEDVWDLEPKKPYRVGYYEAEGDDVDDDVALAGGIRAELFSHLVYAYARVELGRLALVGREGDEQDEDAVKERDVLLRFHAECKRGGAIPMVALRGSLEEADVDADTDTWRFLASLPSRKTFVANLVKWMEAWDFRGLEFHSTPRNKRRREFIQLVVETRAALSELSATRGVRYWLSVSIPVDYPWIDVGSTKKALVTSVDWVMVTAQEASKVVVGVGSGLKKLEPTSAHAPIFSSSHPSIASVVDKWLRKGVPRGKILLALSACGTVWKLENGDHHDYGAPSLGKTGSSPIPYRSILLRFSGSSGRLGVFHPPTSTVYAHLGVQWVSYDDPRTIALKVDYVVQAGLLGYGLWSLNMDSNTSLAQAAASRSMVPLPIITAPMTGSVMMVTSAYPEPCSSPRGDHLLNKALKNKVDYAEIHGMRVFASSALIDGMLNSEPPRRFRAPTVAWAKVPLLMELMSHHSEVEWFMWAGPEVVFINLFQPLHLAKYRGHNLVLPFQKLPAKDGSTEEKTIISTGAFLLRNCKWSYNLLQTWLELALPESASDLQNFREHLGVEGADELPDDALALLHLMKHKLHITLGAQGPRIFFEPHGRLNNAWQHVLNILPALNDKATSAKTLKKSPLLTEFTRCQFCKAAQESSLAEMETCFDGMEMAFVSGDNQMLSRYGLQHLNLTTPELRQLTEVKIASGEL